MSNPGEARFVIFAPSFWWYTGRHGEITLPCGDRIKEIEWYASSHYRVAKRFTASEVGPKLKELEPGWGGLLRVLDIRDLDADYAADALEKLEALRGEG